MRYREIYKNTKKLSKNDKKLSKNDRFFVGNLQNPCQRAGNPLYIVYMLYKETTGPSFTLVRKSDYSFMREASMFHVVPIPGKVSTLSRHGTPGKKSPNVSRMSELYMVRYPTHHHNMLNSLDLFNPFVMRGAQTPQTQPALS